MSVEKFGLAVKGHVTITDDTGEVILDADNAVHPQNIGRIIARALAKEQNSSVYRIAFGNGGTFIDAAGNLAFRTANDGQLPDITSWQSRLYSEVYTEVADDSSALLSSGPGAVPSGDPSTVGVRSRALADTTLSQVEVTCVLNANEPSVQLATSMDPTVTDFEFDEIGLFSAGLPSRSAPGYHEVDLGVVTESTVVVVPVDRFLSFTVQVDGATSQPITISYMGQSPTTTIGEIRDKINTALVGAAVLVNSPGVNTFGLLKFVSNTTGSASSVVIADGSNNSDWLFDNIFDDMGRSLYQGMRQPVVGKNRGVADLLEDQSQERERLLTHLIFRPLTKTSDRIWTIKYTLDIDVQRSDN